MWSEYERERERQYQRSRNYYKECSRGKACLSYKNNFVYFQHKKVLITQKRRYFNAFLKYIPNYIWKMSVR